MAFQEIRYDQRSQKWTQRCVFIHKSLFNFIIENKNSIEFLRFFSEKWRYKSSTIFSEHL